MGTKVGDAIIFYNPLLSKTVSLNHSPLVFNYCIKRMPVGIFTVSATDPDPGSEIRCFFDPWIRNLGSGIGFFPDPVSQTKYLRAY
jgi:hypothetical protein